ncbi:MAG: HAD family hydrolase [Verrucomicrobiales bacterium]|nr:HAD family hydrolase [Verrucomicrobiales bacterium]
MTTPGVTLTHHGVAVFLDRDGTLNIERNYLSNPDQLVLYPSVPSALSRLQSAGCQLFVVTNQSGIGRGYYTEEDMHRVNRRLLDLLEPHGVHFTQIYFAPESPEAPSRGRKPSPQFLFDARDEFGVDLRRSYMVGDKIADLECGWNAGVRTSILVRTGYGAETERRDPETVRRAVVVEDIGAAAEFILGRPPSP